jgi:cell division protein FtsA
LLAAARGLAPPGLLLAGLEKHEIDQAARIQGASFKHVLERMKSWFQQNF